MEKFPIYGTCNKCGTENSLLQEYRPGYFICSANECWTEELERESGRHIILNKKLEDYRRVIARANG